MQIGKDYIIFCQLIIGKISSGYNCNDAVVFLFMLQAWSWKHWWASVVASRFVVAGAHHRMESRPPLAMAEPHGVWCGQLPTSASQNILVLNLRFQMFIFVYVDAHPRMEALDRRPFRTKFLASPPPVSGEKRTSHFPGSSWEKYKFKNFSFVNPMKNARNYWCGRQQQHEAC